ncbi:MAG: energy-coupling factor ABC transporter permease [Candidatus Competibacteraceae bacterium]|nr:energy-coupling factor ABC transporter permease [Candidatus Competibacteraceae bacterium]
MANFIWVLILWQALRQAPWRAFLAQPNLQHVLLGASVALFLMWIFEAGIRPALGFHFLGVTVYTLMFGWSLGVIGVSLIAVGVTVTSGDWSALAMNALLLGILPVSTSYAVYRLVYRYLPRHLFIYIFLCAFFNAMIAAGAVILTLVTLLVFAESYTFSPNQQ